VVERYWKVAIGYNPTFRAAGCDRRRRVERAGPRRRDGLEAVRVPQQARQALAHLLDLLRRAAALGCAFRHQRRRRLGLGLGLVGAGKGDVDGRRGVEVWVGGVRAAFDVRATVVIVRGTVVVIGCRFIGAAMTELHVCIPLVIRGEHVRFIRLVQSCAPVRGEGKCLALGVRAADVHGCFETALHRLATVRCALVIRTDRADTIIPPETRSQTVFLDLISARDSRARCV
jgi:hypothetical protein